MAAGDLVVADFQFELRGVLFGPGTPFKMRRNSWEGMGLPAVKSQDVDLNHHHGSVGGRDFYAPRRLTWALMVRESSQSAAITKANDAMVAFAVSSTDLPLYGQLPGWGRFRVTGRPRGCVMNLSRIALGRVELFATFDALDPTIHTVSL